MVSLDTDMVKFKNIKKTREKEEKQKKPPPKPKETTEKTTKIRSWEFPNINRLIAERRFWLSVINVLALLGMLLVGIGLGKYLEKAAALRAKREGLAMHIAFLQDLSQKFPQDRDIFLEIATEEYQLGDMNQADSYVEKALVLDPNYLPALKLKGYILTNRK